jgi:ribose/xylose/arabinose/galactoside ABC-type transport system permease subunit
MLRGIIQIINQGKNKSFPPEFKESLAYNISSGELLGIPVQMFWALGFVIFAIYLFNRHRFGAQVKIVGDNPDSARAMAINVDWVRVNTFIFMGLGAALAAIFSTMINFTWFTTSGEGYLLPVLASVFVGGTPTWGGIGTVAGGAIGALTVQFIETGIVAVGGTGFYIRFFEGLIIILSLIGHRWNQARYR